MLCTHLEKLHALIGCCKRHTLCTVTPDARHTRSQTSFARKGKRSGGSVVSAAAKCAAQCGVATASPEAHSSLETVSCVHEVYLSRTCFRTTHRSKDPEKQVWNLDQTTVLIYWCLMRSSEVQTECDMLLNHTICAELCAIS